MLGIWNPGTETEVPSIGIQTGKKVSFDAPKGA